MKMSVVGERCMGHGRCYRLLPDLLTFDDEGYVSIRDETVVVPEDQQELAEDAQATCPEDAIVLTSD